MVPTALAAVKDRGRVLYSEVTLTFNNESFLSKEKKTSQQLLFRYHMSYPSLRKMSPNLADSLAQVK